MSGTLSTSRRRNAGLSMKPRAPPNSISSCSWRRGESSMPALRWIAVQAAISDPTAMAVVPPGLGVFSRRMTLRPSLAASAAAHRPAPPPPTTMTSAEFRSFTAQSPQTSGRAFLRLWRGRIPRRNRRGRPLKGLKKAHEPGQVGACYPARFRPPMGEFEDSRIQALRHRSRLILGVGPCLMR